MGNNCVAGGGTPQRANITLANNTKYELSLDTSKVCGRECGHHGWQVLEGKVVEGLAPPATIQPYSSGHFSVSGREGSAVAPKGKVFYINKEINLKVLFDWTAAGWTSPLGSSAAAIQITGIPPAGGLLSSKPVPWDQALVGDSDPATWIYNLRPQEGSIAEMRKTVKSLENFKVGL
jgi:hypothetical protein